MLKNIKISIDSYLNGKTWYWYVIPWLFGLYIFVKLLGFDLNEQMPFVVAIPHSFNFMLHEMSHILTAFLPQIVSAASGSFSELLLGLLLIYGAFKTYSYFASLFCFLWFMLACFSVSSYMADARAQNIQLVSLGNGFSGSEGVVHDWNFIFGELGLLGLDTFISGTIWLTGFMAGLVGLLFGAYLIIRMISSPNTNSTMSDEEAALLHSATAATGIKPLPIDHYKNIAKDSIYPKPSKGRITDDSNERFIKP